MHSLWLAPASVGTALLLLIEGAAAGGPAINQFELKDLQAEPGRVQFQSQNAHSWSQPRRRSAVEDSELLFDENSVTQQRHALEMEMGLTRWFKTRVGIEFEKERVDDPGSLAAAEAFDSLKLTEVALEGILVLLPPKKYPVGVGLLAEFQHPVESAEASTLFFGPLFQAFVGPWAFNVNLFFVRFFGGEPEERDEKWDFSYASQVKYSFSENIALALEAYGTIDRLGDTGRRTSEALLFGDHDQHRMGPVVYYSFRPEGLGKAGHRGALRNTSGMTGVADDDGPEGENGVEVILGVGLLFGLNRNTPDTTLKWSVEVEF